MKNLRPTMHFYYPEAVQKGKKIKIDERFYIDFVLRERILNKGYGISHYGINNVILFEKSLSVSQHKQDKFFIIFDTDFRHSNDLYTISNQMRSLAKRYCKLSQKGGNHLDFLISSRAFETYLCMYNRDSYTKALFKYEKLISRY
ncbi:hypothetical protein ACN9VA_08170 [Staphylococcus caprae]|uniref:hypothetical protein n=1 Tax=Staphylococcus caprae TaxID=29380 RepID=UPI001C10B6EA|nr:hypothetical protein [Staphylococcus caprae]MBU5272101.1 hypothetical protein [Staphylococcus caprae]